MTWRCLFAFAMLSLPALAKAQVDSVERMILQPPLTVPIIPRELHYVHLRPGIVTLGANNDSLLEPRTQWPPLDTRGHLMPDQLRLMRIYLRVRRDTSLRTFP